jgi:hypothetical protein
MTDFQTNPEMTEANPFLNFTDADLKAALRRAMRSCVAMGFILSGILAFVMGWRIGAHTLVGALISLTSLYEWEQLIAYVNARLDHQKPPRSTARVAAMFFVHLIFAAMIIYVTLKLSSGIPYGLVAGLGLGIVALTIEAVRLIRS